MPPIDPRVPAYHAQASTLDWSDREAVVEYSVGAWRLLAGSAHPFDEATIRTLAAQDFERTNNLLTTMNHALLSGGERWFDRLDEVCAPALIIHSTEDPVHELHRDDWRAILDAVERHTA
jgi:pimeloyl-ACP methyl ester carboxylesterase